MKISYYINKFSFLAISNLILFTSLCANDTILVDQDSSTIETIQTIENQINSDSLSILVSEPTNSKDEIISTDEKKDDGFDFTVSTELPPGTITDSIYLFDGTIILVDFKKMTYKNIYFTNPGEMEMVLMDRRKVHKIIYKRGLVEIVNTIEKNIPNSKDWKYILVTENKSEVEDYMKIEKIKGSSRQMKEDVSDETLEKSALIVLKKKAARLNADIVLITNKSIYRGYGELPSMIIKGIAYKMN